MPVNYLPYVTLGISLLTTAVTIGIAVGALKSRIAGIEKDLGSIGKRFNDDIKNIKDEYIKQLSERTKEQETELKNVGLQFGRMEERLKAFQENIGEKIDTLTEKLETLL